MAIKKYHNGAWETIPYKRYETSTDTLTTLPAEVIADGNNATVGVKGNMSQSGTPTPQNPIQPSETGEKTGNLANPDNRISNANITASGVISSNNNTDMGFFEIENGKTYAVNSYVIGFFTSKPSLSSVSYDNVRYVGTVDEPYIFTAPITGYCAFRVGLNSRMIACEGSQLISYEPYGFKIPILSANTTTPVYLGEVQTTRKIAKLALTGQENIAYQNVSSHSRFAISSQYQTANYLIGLCSHYNYQYANQNYNIYHSSNNSDTNIYIFDDNYTSADDFKTYLQQQYSNGTPVTIWYVLATPTTAIVNEPIRKIGDYADTVSGISVPTLGTSEQLDVDTTLKPSEVQLTYTGWHNKSDTKF